MKTGLGNQAFTIIETLIVLAVSAMMILIALLLVGNQQQKNEFIQAAHDIQSEMNQVISNVQNGYYALPPNGLNCQRSTTSPVIPEISAPATGGNKLGTNSDCVLMGRAMQFGVNGKPADYNIYNLAGLRNSSANANVLSANLMDARPIALSSYGGGAYPAAEDTTESNTLEYGLGVGYSGTQQAMSFTFPGTTNLASAIAFITDPGSTGTNGLNPGTQAIRLYGVEATSLNNSADTRDNVVQELNRYNFLIQADSAKICFDDGRNTNHSAVITIGSNNRQLSTSLDFKNGPCP